MPHCSYYFRMKARDRINLIADEGSFIEMDFSMASKNLINFPGYEKKLSDAASISGNNEAVITGECKINGIDAVIGVMDSFFMMGSMGSVVGEKITRAMEKGIEKNIPVIIFTASGGARMQEGLISLQQMAKTSACIAKLNENGILFIIVLTDPTTGGVTASFAMLRDIIIAEKGATVGFAGKRVIEQTIRENLPEGFQTSEFLLQHGFADIVAERENLKQVLGDILSLHKGGNL